MRQQLGIVGFRKFYPGWAAAGKLWQRFFAFCDTFHQLTGFFHDRKVSSKISIQHIICSQFFQQRYHFTFNKTTVSHAKFFAQSNTHRRRGAENNDLFGIAHRCRYFVGFYLFCNTICRAHIGTLPAVDADGHISGRLEIVGATNSNVVSADRLTGPAFDTFEFQSLHSRIIRFNSNTDICKLMFAHIKEPPLLSLPLL